MIATDTRIERGSVTERERGGEGGEDGKGEGREGEKGSVEGEIGGEEQ